jgi:biopolymer transport protein ExbD
MKNVKEIPGFHQVVMSGIRSSRRVPVGIRMTPMIDIIFLLLAFFVLTAKFQESEQLLPVIVGKTSTKPIQAKQKPLKIYARTDDTGCFLSVNNHPPIRMSDQDQNQALLALARKVQTTLSPIGPAPVELYYDDAVSWDVVVKVYDVLYALGLENITFRIQE